MEHQAYLNLYGIEYGVLGACGGSRPCLSSVVTTRAQCAGEASPRTRPDEVRIRMVLKLGSYLAWHILRRRPRGTSRPAGLRTSLRSGHESKETNADHSTKTRGIEWMDVICIWNEIWHLDGQSDSGQVCFDRYSIARSSKDPKSMQQQC
jgi:hypothetical protein